jgi:ribonuclease R
VQVSRVDLDGRKIDFRLVHEGEDLPGRAMKDKAGGRAADLPERDRAQSRTGADKRGEQRGGKRGEPRAAARGGSSSDGRAPKSPIQALKAAVKKSAAGAGRKQGKKPRR